ncbi:MAG: transcription elongation factor GreA [Minisyncoccia bacterium]
MSDQIYLSKEKYEELKQELEERKTKIRNKIANDLKHAKELGDLSENAAYAEAKEAKQKNDQRIAELESILHNCIIVEKQEKNDKVNIGSTVKLEDENGNISEYTIVGSLESDPGKKCISFKSPLGESLLNRKVGDEVTFCGPNNNCKKYKILEIK